MAELTFLKLQQRVLMHVHGETDTSNVNSTFLDQVKYAINRALTEITNDVKMFTSRKNGSFGLVEGQEEYLLPSDFQKVVNDTIYFDDGSNSTKLKELTEQEWTRQGGKSVTTNGKPIYSTMSRYDSDMKAWVMAVRPKPSSSYDGNLIRFKYYGAPSEMTADTDVPPLPDYLHDGLINGAVVFEFMSYLQDQQVSSFHLKAWDDYRRNCRRHADPVMGRSLDIKGNRRGSPRVTGSTNLDLPF